MNPTPTEAEELKDVSRLSEDPNDPDNIIPLCTGCHTRFDMPRTRGEYLEMFRVKSNLLERERQRALMRQYPMEDAIRLIVNALGDPQRCNRSSTIYRHCVVSQTSRP